MSDQHEEHDRSERTDRELSDLVRKVERALIEVTSSHTYLGQRVAAMDSRLADIAKVQGTQMVHGAEIRNIRRDMESIQDNHRWMVRTVVGQVVVIIAGILVVAAKSGVGL